MFCVRNLYTASPLTHSPSSNSRSVQFRMSSASFLHNYRNAVRVKCLFGVCPFSIATRIDGTSAAVCDLKSTVYTVLHSMFMISVYMYLFYLQFYYNTHYKGTTSTPFISILIEHFTMMLVYPAILLLSLRKRAAHERLLNAIAAVYDQMTEHSAGVGSEPRSAITNLNRLYRLNQLWMATNCVGTFVAFWLCVYIDQMSAASLAYFTMFHVAMFSTCLCVGYVRDTVHVLCDVHRAGLMALRQHDSDCMTCVILLQAVQRAIAEMVRCFGAVMLLCTLKDFVFLTAVLFYVLLEWANWRISVIHAYFVVIYVLPIVVNLALISQAFGWLENGWQDVQSVIGGRGEFEDDGNVSGCTIPEHRRAS